MVVRFLVATLFIILHFTGSYSQSVVQGGMIASSLKFASVNGIAPGIIFGSGNSEIRITAHDTNGLTIETPSSSLIAFKPDNSVEIGAQQLIINSSLDIEGMFRVNNVSQWILVHQEDFSSNKAIGWDNKNPDLVTECAGIHMLGGYKLFAKGEASKKITNLPPHDQVRVKANFHFIDAWVGETGFMRLNIGKDGSMVYVWTDRHNQNQEAFAVNVCGSGTPEGKFSVPIDVAITHASSDIIIGFGSTIENGNAITSQRYKNILYSEDASDQSWGVSSIEVYIR